MSLQYIRTRESFLDHLERLMIINEQAQVAGHDMEAMCDAYGAVFIRCTATGCLATAGHVWGHVWGQGLDTYHISEPCTEPTMTHRIILIPCHQCGKEPEPGELFGPVCEECVG